MTCGNAVVASAQVDLSTGGALHAAFLTGMGSAKILTIKKFMKTHAISLIPHPHALNSGTPGFGNKFSYKLGRQGDYLTSSWVRFEVSAVEAPTLWATSASYRGLYLRWCHNLGHNLIECATLNFTTIPGCTFDSTFFDFYSAFSVPGGKRNAYDNMIGNVPELVNPVWNIAAGVDSQTLPAAILNVPIPMPYSREAGVSLPTGALIYNDNLLELKIREWTECLVVSNAADSTIQSVVAHSSRIPTSADVVAAPTLDAQLWGTYVVVTSDERKRMGKVPRDIVWEVIQTMPEASVLTGATTVDVGLKYSHAVKVLFFAIRNKTVDSDRSNYTTREPFARAASNLTTLEFPAPNAFDPIEEVDLLYEGTQRLSEMPIDYFSLVQPFYHAAAIPTITGYHMYSYALDAIDVNHSGSVDYGKLTNVSLCLTLSTDCLAALAGTAVTPFVDEVGNATAFPAGYTALGLTYSGFVAIAQTFEVINCAMAHTVLRVIGGGAGFPMY